MASANGIAYGRITKWQQDQLQQYMATSSAQAV
jgi:hypothetical protein